MYQIMVALAGNAVRNKYPITSAEISQLCRELDLDTGNWYENRHSIKKLIVHSNMCIKIIFKKVKKTVYIV